MGDSFLLKKKAILNAKFENCCYANGRRSWHAEATCAIQRTEWIGLLSKDFGYSTKDLLVHPGMS